MKIGDKLAVAFTRCLKSLILKNKFNIKQNVY